MPDIQALVNKILSDEAFRKALLSNPEATLRQAGIDPTPEMLDALKDIDEDSLQALAENFFNDEKAAR